MTTPEDIPDDDPAMFECQREGTCCATCQNDYGACCKHDGKPVPEWVYETS